MSDNSSITGSSNHFIRYLTAVILPIYLCYYLSLGFFIWSPEYFYRRSWEYFRDIAYHNPKKRVWEGYEIGDFSLAFLACKGKNARKTIVSCDEHGFRITPLSTKRYPILLVGDCNIWGVNLSDQETIPWLLAKSLNIPVFNGGRTPGAKTPYLLESLLNHSSLQECKIVIEFVRDVIIDKDLFSKEFSCADFQSFIQKEGAIIDTIPIKRYFFPSKIITQASWLYNSFMAPWNKEGLSEEIHFLRSSQELEAIVKNVKNRADFLQRRGYRYIFIPLPTKAHVMTKKIYGDPAAQNMQLIDALKEKGIESFDLYLTFRDKEDGLFIKEDSHIGPYGAKLIARELEAYLQESDNIL